MHQFSVHFRIIVGVFLYRMTRDEERVTAGQEVYRRVLKQGNPELMALV